MSARAPLGVICAIALGAITPQNFARGRRLTLHVNPARAGALQRITLPAGLHGYLAVRGRRGGKPRAPARAQAAEVSLEAHRR